MGSKEKNLDHGLGGFNEVRDHHIEAFLHDDGVVPPLGNLAKELEELGHSPRFRRATLAIVASFLNESLVKTGRLFRVDNDDNMVSDFVIEDSMRQLLTDSFG